MDYRRGALIKKPDGGYALSGLQIPHGLIDRSAQDSRLRLIRPTDFARFD